MSSEGLNKSKSASQLPAVTTAGLDWLSDLVIPAAVFGLLGTLLYFLIDLRQYLFGGEAAILRYVVLWFLIGVIALARLSARPHTASTPPILYATALAIVVAWVTISLTSLEGPWAASGRYRSPGMATLLNLAIVAGIWAAAWLLTGVCTRPEHALEELRSGGVTSRQGYAGAVAAPLRAVLVVAGIAIALFGYGLGIVHPADALHRHAFACAALFLLFALLLMALVTLGAARLAAHDGGLRVRGRIVAVWLAGAGLLAASALGVALAFPQVASRLKPRPHAVSAPFVQDTRRGHGVGTRSGTSSWADRVPGGARKLIEQLMRGRRQQPGAPPRQGQGQGRQVQAPMPVPVGSRPPWWWLWILLAAAALAAAYHFRRQIARLFKALWNAMLAAVSRIVAWLSVLLRWSARGVEMEADPWADIFAHGAISELDPAVAVRHVWRALQLYYDAMGCGRRGDETELEFARRAPARYSISSDDVQRVARLYCAIEYGDVRLGGQVVEQMQQLWSRLMASVAAARSAAQSARVS